MCWSYRTMIYLLVESIRYNYYILVQSVVVDEFLRMLDDFLLALSLSQILYRKSNEFFFSPLSFIRSHTRSEHREQDWA